MRHQAAQEPSPCASRLPLFLLMTIVAVLMALLIVYFVKGRHGDTSEPHKTILKSAPQDRRRSSENGNSGLTFTGGLNQMRTKVYNALWKFAAIHNSAIE